MLSAESIVAIFAPHHCVNCGKEGSLLCPVCASDLPPHPSICYRCHSLSPHFRTCSKCRRHAPLHGVTVATLYEEPLRTVLRRLKFERARAAAQPLAQLLVEELKTTKLDLVTCVPSASSRQRRRGYNPAEEIAKRMAGELKVTYRSVLGRLGQQRQVGARRKDRLAQLQGAFYIRRPNLLAGKRVLLVDDVMTTGATLAECARVLKAAGASRIDAAVVARHHT